MERIARGYGLEAKSTAILGSNCICTFQYGGRGYEPGFFIVSTSWEMMRLRPIEVVFR